MLNFQKYVAVGNDFIIIDAWETEISLSADQVIKFCDRKFGIGADGVLILIQDKQADFRMIYFNADGSRGEMCGNGARSLIHYAVTNGRCGASGTFIADDGLHNYRMEDSVVSVQILVTGSLKPWDVPSPQCGFINTGVPHLIVPVDKINSIQLETLGPAMNEHELHPEGSNVNILERSEGELLVRTWERGVNAETLACGTGAVAVAIFANGILEFPWPISLKFTGGDLSVDLIGNQYWLTGNAELVFEGQIL